jgi:SAM-dependent methyltransferase
MGECILDWIERALAPRTCTSTELLYDHMASQSDEHLPLIYQPFDVDNPGHWAHRGYLFDYLHTTGGGRVLDFGPGDGWPSLILAPFVDEVVGVDGSRRRVEVCRANAERMGIENARFLYVEPGSPLPFDEGSFDGVTAASSVEQTPDPRATLRELYRVLRAGGKLRVHYEALSRRQCSGHQQGAWLLDLGEGASRLIVDDRDIEGEQARTYGLTLDAGVAEATALLAPGQDEVSYEALTVSALARARPRIVEALACARTYPSGRTLVTWLREFGFSEVLPTHGGGYFAWQLHETLAGAWRPGDLEALDAYLDPIIHTVVQFLAPLEMNPMITAVK